MAVEVLPDTEREGWLAGWHTDGLEEGSLARANGDDGELWSNEDATFARAKGDFELEDFG